MRLLINQDYINYFFRELIDNTNNNINDLSELYPIKIL